MEQKVEINLVNDICKLEAGFGYKIELEICKL